MNILSQANRLRGKSGLSQSQALKLTWHFAKKQTAKDQFIRISFRKKNGEYTERLAPLCSLQNAGTCIRFASIADQGIKCARKDLIQNIEPVESKELEFASLMWSQAFECCHINNDLKSTIQYLQDTQPKPGRA